MFRCAEIPFATLFLATSYSGRHHREAHALKAAKICGLTHARDNTAIPTLRRMGGLPHITTEVLHAIHCVSWTRAVDPLRARHDPQGGVT